MIGTIYGTARKGLKNVIIKREFKNLPSLFNILKGIEKEYYYYEIRVDASEE